MLRMADRDHLPRSNRLVSPEPPLWYDDPSYQHGGSAMATVKVAITMEREMLERVDRLVEVGIYPNRSRAIEAAVAEKIARVNRGRLAVESAKLDARFEKAMAEEGLGHEVDSWPEY
jgi:Arc/MetJ-type ribon-helix-helix transcriptional regulator